MLCCLRCSGASPCGSCDSRERQPKSLRYKPVFLAAFSFHFKHLYLLRQIVRHWSDVWSFAKTWQQDFGSEEGNRTVFMYHSHFFFNYLVWILFFSIFYRHFSWNVWWINYRQKLNYNTKNCVSVFTSLLMTKLHMKWKSQLLLS